ncbi:MAG: cell wall-associated protein wapA [Pseudobdellovibrio sp.]|jgi:YD repeat-containing protein|nr:cell wall-associated protein wapA [Pseudobdellovibrio sp.]
MTKLSKFLVGSVLAFSTVATAAVDIKSGAYTIRRSDQSLEREFSGFVIDRVYNSTVGYDGLFGFGWCSGFETVLRVVAKGQIAVVECGAGQVKVFNSADFKESNTAEAVDLLAAAMQKAGQTMTQALRNEMTISRHKRTKMLAKYGVKFEVSKSAYSIVPFSNDEQVTYGNNQFTLKTENGLTQIFDEGGRLIQQKHKSGDVIKLSYDQKGRLASVDSQRGQTFKFKLDDNGHVTELRGLSETTRYTYKGSLLVKVSQKSGEEVYGYTDDLMTLVQIGNRKTELKYNPATRFISQLKGQDCTDDYKYDIDKAALKFKVSFNSACTGAEAISVTYDFEYQKAADGTIFQKKMTAKDAKGRVTSAEYAAEAKPVKIVQGGREYKYEYDSQNRVTGKETPTQRIEYSYLEKGIISSAKVTEKGKKASEVVHYNYDKERKLASVSLGGETIKYHYDAKARLTKIETKTGPSFTIQNDGLTGQVKRIVAQGVGYFEMKYSSSGQLIKSDWKGDISKAMGIIERYEALRTPYDQSLEIGAPL